MSDSSSQRIISISLDAEPTPQHKLLAKTILGDDVMVMIDLLSDVEFSQIIKDSYNTDTFLHKVILKSNNPFILQLLIITHHLNPTALIDQDTTFILSLIETGNIPMIDMLLSLDVIGPGPYKIIESITPQDLSYAAIISLYYLTLQTSLDINTKRDILQSLRQRGYSPDLPPQFDQSVLFPPVIYAFLGGELENGKLLIEFGANPILQSKRPITLLTLTTFLSNVEQSITLLDYILTDLKPLFQAGKVTSHSPLSKEDAYNILFSLEHEYPDGSSALSIMLSSQKYHIIKHLIDTYNITIPPRYQGGTTTALHLLCEAQEGAIPNKDLLELIYNLHSPHHYSIDEVDGKNKTPLMYTTPFNEMGTNFLLEHGANARLLLLPNVGGGNIYHLPAVRLLYESNMETLVRKFPNEDINARNLHSYTPLEFAIMGSNLAAIRFLLKCPNIKLNYLIPHAAMVCDLHDRSKEALKLTPNVNTLLHMGVMTGNVEIVQLLLDAGVDPTLTKMPTLYELACRYDYVDILQFLFENKNKYSKQLSLVETKFPPNSPNAFNLFEAAVAHSSYKCMKYLCTKQKYNVNKLCKGETFLITAATTGDLPLMKALVEAGADTTVLSSNGFSIIHYAAKQNNMKLLQYAIDVVPKYINLRGKAIYAPIGIAIGFGNLPAVKLLHENGANILFIDDRGRNIFHQLADAGPDDDHSSPHNPYEEYNSHIGGKRTKALKIAQYICQFINTKHMFEYDCRSNIDHVDFSDLNLRDYQGCTPIFVAAACGNVELMQFLWDKGSNRTIKATKHKFSLLEIAYQGGYRSTSWVLSQKHSVPDAKGIYQPYFDPNVHDPITGMTPLQSAVYYNFSFEAIRALIDHKANPSLQTTGGKSLLQLASDPEMYRYCQRILSGNRY